MPSTSLREIQERFLAGLREGSDGIDATGPALIADPPVGKVWDRWHLYTEGYVIRLTEAMENDYPAVARVLGQPAFESLCQRYLHAFPPYSPDIGRAGDRLVEFLRTDPLPEKLPFLRDLARFELMLARAIVAANSRPASWEEIAKLGVEKLLDVRITLSPGAAVLRAEWPVTEIWALKDVPDSEVSLDLEGRPSTLVLFREGFEVRWREIEHDEALFLECLAEKSASLADLADSGRFGSPEQAAPLLVSLFRSAIESAIVGVGSHLAQTRE